MISDPVASDASEFGGIDFEKVPHLLGAYFACLANNLPRESVHTALSLRFTWRERRYFSGRFVPMGDDHILMGARETGQDGDEGIIFYLKQTDGSWSIGDRLFMFKGLLDSLTTPEAALLLAELTGVTFPERKD